MAPRLKVDDVRNRSLLITVGSDNFTDTNYATGQPIFNISPNSPPPMLDGKPPAKD